MNILALNTKNEPGRQTFEYHIEQLRTSTHSKQYQEIRLQESHQEMVNLHDT